MRALRVLLWFLLTVGVSAQSPSLRHDYLEPLTPADWLSWPSRVPCDVHLLREGAAAEAWGQLDFQPLAVARGRRTVVLAGRDHLAVRAFPGEGDFEVIARPGWWDAVAATVTGFVASDGRSVVFSADGRTWETVEAPMMADGSCRGLAAGDGKFVMLVERRIDDGMGTRWLGGDIWTSADGRSWTRTHYGETTLENMPYERIAYQNRRWVVLGRYNALHSPDAEHWEVMASDAEETAYETAPPVAFIDFRAGGGSWWIRGEGDDFLRSDDGLTWRKNLTGPDYLNPFGFGSLTGRWEVGPQGMRHLELGPDGVLAVLDPEQARRHDRELALAAEAERAAEAPERSPAVAAPEPLQVWRLDDAFRPASPVVYADGHYAVGGSRGRVYFSTDGRAWHLSEIDDDHDVSLLRHDGLRWIASVGGRSAAFSPDLTTWTAPRPLVSPDATVWRGLFWSPSHVLGVSLFNFGRYGEQPEENRNLRIWDGQLDEVVDNQAETPRAMWATGDRVMAIMPGGLGLSTDNGEYWNVAFGLPTRDPERVYYAEGNNRAVLFVVTGKSEQGKVLLSVKTGEAFMEVIEAVPFAAVSGLAYESGRFVALAQTTVDAPWQLHESRDGLAWEAVTELLPQPLGLAAGGGVFMVNFADGRFLSYGPEPWPEAPGRLWAATDVPPINFKRFTRNERTGKGARGSRDQPEVERIRALMKRSFDGEAVAKTQLATAIRTSMFVVSNPWKAEELYREAIALGDPLASAGLAELLKAWKPESSAAEIAALYRQGAERGDNSAIVEVVRSLVRDDTTPVAELTRWSERAKAADPTFARRWERYETYRQQVGAAERGELEAVLAAAPILIEGDLIASDPTRAAAWLEQAVADGSVAAMMALTQAYEKQVADRVPAAERCLDGARYVAVLEQAARAGDLQALETLLMNLAMGRNEVKRDDAKAYALALEFAEAGQHNAMAYVASALIMGRGVDQDEAAGKAWMQQAADAGNAQAAAWLKQQAALGKP